MLNRIFVPMFGKIKDMFSLERWIENFEGYLDARIELVKYDVKELLVDVMTRSIFYLGMAIFALAGLICLNFGVAFLINHLIGNEFSGFLILAILYFLIAMIFYWNRDNTSLNEKIELKIRESLKQPRKETNENKEENG